MLTRRGQPSLVPALATVPPDALPSDDHLALVERVSPMCEVLYLMMSADGRCDESERELLRGAVRVLTAGSLRSAQIDLMLEGFERQRVACGADARLQKVAGHLQVDRVEAEAAYSLAAAMALVDEDVDGLERHLLDELGDLLGLSAKRRTELTKGPER